MKAALAKVHEAYPEARFIAEDSGLRLLPSATHIMKLPSSRLARR